MSILRDVLSVLHSPQDADRILTAFAKNPTLGGRFNIVESVRLDMGRMAGLQADPERWAKYVQDGDVRVRKYLPGDMDMDYNAQGELVPMGVFKAHLNDTVALPGMRELYLSANKGRFTNALFRASNADVLDRMMDYWRPFTLARLGFATRVGGEEALGFILREGPLAYMRSVAGQLAYNSGGSTWPSGAKVSRRPTNRRSAGKPMEHVWATAKDAVTLSDHGRAVQLAGPGPAPAQVDGATASLTCGGAASPTPCPHHGKGGGGFTRVSTRPSSTRWWLGGRWKTTATSRST